MRSAWVMMRCAIAAYSATLRSTLRSSHAILLMVNQVTVWALKVLLVVWPCV